MINLYWHWQHPRHICFLYIIWFNFTTNLWDVTDISIFQMKKLKLRKLIVFSTKFSKGGGRLWTMLSKVWVHLPITPAHGISLSFYSMYNCFYRATNTLPEISLPVNFIFPDFSICGKYKQVQRIRGSWKVRVSEPRFWQWTRQQSAVKSIRI